MAEEEAQDAGERLLQHVRELSETPGVEEQQTLAEYAAAAVAAHPRVLASLQAAGFDEHAKAFRHPPDLDQLTHLGVNLDCVLHAPKALRPERERPPPLSLRVISVDESDGAPEPAAARPKFTMGADGTLEPPRSNQMLVVDD